MKKHLLYYELLYGTPFFRFNFYKINSRIQSFDGKGFHIAGQRFLQHLLALHIIDKNMCAAYIRRGQFIKSKNVFS